MSQPEEEKILQELIENLSLLTAKNTVVLVEDREDEAFWERIIQEFAPEVKPYFPYFSSTGKSGLKRFADHVSKKVLICVDSDNDGFHRTANTVWLSPRRRFIYQTYAHSRENHLIHPENLSQDCKDLVYKTHDFQHDFEEISGALFIFLLLWLFLTDQDRKDDAKYLKKDLGVKFSWEDLKNLIDDCFNNANFNEAQNLEEARMLITEFIEHFANHAEETKHIFFDNSLDQLWDDFENFKNQCPIEPIDTLWYIRGHQVFDDIIVPYFNKIIQIISTEEARTARTKEDRNRWNNMANSRTSFRDRLLISYRNCLSSSQNCRFFELIKKDFQTDFSK